MSNTREVPTREYLLSKFYYKDGFIYWAEREMSRGRPLIRAHRRINTFADEYAYLRCVIDKETYMLARIIYQIHHGDLTPEFEVDHIDRNKLNNDISNLRKITQTENKRNKSRQKNNTTGYPGIDINVKAHPFPNNHKSTRYYRVAWKSSGRREAKYFNIDRLGDEQALKLAIEFRKAVLKEEAEKGNVFSEGHGQDSVMKKEMIEAFLEKHNIPKRTPHIKY